MILFPNYVFQVDQTSKRAYEEAKKFGTVKMAIVKCLTLGIAGVGKTSLKHLLLPETNNHPGIRVSTGLADNPVQVYVGSMDSLLAHETNHGEWHVMDENELMKILVESCQIKHPEIPSPRRPSIEDDSPAHSTSEEYLQVERAFIEKFSNKSDGENRTLDLKVIEFIDSGGQPQFLELMPAFVQNISVALFVVNLSENLDFCPEICFYGKNGEKMEGQYKSQSSHMTVMEQCLRTLKTTQTKPRVFVVGTHKDKLLESPKHQNDDARDTDATTQCLESLNQKNEKIKSMQLIDHKHLICKDTTSVIWDLNTSNKSENDTDLVNNLRKNIAKNNNINSSDLPLTWFVYQMVLKKCKMRHFSDCVQLASELRVNISVEDALKHMVKYNLVLWYHENDDLKDVVFCDPQTIIAVINDLVKVRYDPKLWKETGVRGTFHTEFCKCAIVDNEMLSASQLKIHFNELFTKEYFTKLMCHLCCMVSLQDGRYLMPALLDTLGHDEIISWCKMYTSAEPLVIYFLSSEYVPYGLFSCLIAFVHRKYSFQLPLNVHRNCVAFQKNDEESFTIIDSVKYIELHIQSDNYQELCSEIRSEIVNGIEECAKNLHYDKIKKADLKLKFFCGNSSGCNLFMTPITSNKESPIKARCKVHGEMVFTERHTAWFKTSFNSKLSQCMGYMKHKRNDI